MPSSRAEALEEMLILMLKKHGLKPPEVSYPRSQLHTISELAFSTLANIYSGYCKILSSHKLIYCNVSDLKIQSTQIFKNLVSNLISQSSVFQHFSFNLIEHLTLDYLFIYLLTYLKSRIRERNVEAASIHWLTLLNGCKGQGWARLRARSLELHLSLIHRFGAWVLGPFYAVFPDMLAKKVQVEEPGLELSPLWDTIRDLMHYATTQATSK